MKAMKSLLRQCQLTRKTLGQCLEHRLALPRCCSHVDMCLKALTKFTGHLSSSSIHLARACHRDTRHCGLHPGSITGACAGAVEVKALGNQQRPGQLLKTTVSPAHGRKPQSIAWGGTIRSDNQDCQIEPVSRTQDRRCQNQDISLSSHLGLASIRLLLRDCHAAPCLYWLHWSFKGSRVWNLEEVNTASLLQAHHLAASACSSCQGHTVLKMRFSPP